MRTTIDIDDALFRETKQVAAEEGTSLRVVVENALRAALRERKQRPRRRQTVPVSTRRGGLQPGAQLDDSASLLDRMEDRDGNA